MISEFALAFALLQPVYWERDATIWGGRVVRTWNEVGHGIEVTLWPETRIVIVALGYRGKWLKCFRAW